MTVKNSKLYSGFEICTNLKPNQKCFRVRSYKEGKYYDTFHEHIPKHRISQDNAINFLKTLIVKYLEWNDSYVLGAYLNNRGKKPAANQSIQMPIEYPEPGVMRRYCCSGNVNIWMDEVIQPDEFRKNQT